MNSKTAVKHPELVAIDGSDGKIHFGGRNEWFPAPIQRQLRGGAVVAAEVLSYLAATRSGLEDLYPPKERRTQEEFERLMDQVWSCFTPEGREQLTLQNFMDGLTAYTGHAGHPLMLYSLDISPDRSKRPSADRCQGFIDDAMSRDTPVAFLNRSHGEGEGEVVCNWSLIVGQVGNRVILADNGVQRPIDFRLWHDTSSLGGALVFAILHPLR